MNYKVLFISFAIIMTIAYGGLYQLQGVEASMNQRVILTLVGMVIANLIAVQWKREIDDKKQS